jgi:ATP-binding cassette subfamily F protein uup
MPRLAADIAALEAVLADADLYARDPRAFDQAMTGLAAKRETLHAAEDEWLHLEDRRESLTR